jgi:8-oxo-dGTP pyrophosphatase MutT (NUDIX family)
MCKNLIANRKKRVALFLFHDAVYDSRIINPSAGTIMNNKAIIDSISAYTPETATETEFSAAVLILVARDAEDKLFLILTKRPDTIATYAGDYCFPGGMRDTGEADLKATIIREVAEELSIIPTYYQFIGQLDDFFDRFDNLVRPFVATISKEDFEKHNCISESEIEEIYFLPIENLTQLEINPTLEKLIGRHPSYSYTHEKVFIWGLTASILVQFANIVLNLDKPVARHRNKK